MPPMRTAAIMQHPAPLGNESGRSRSGGWACTPGAAGLPPPRAGVNGVTQDVYTPMRPCLVQIADRN